jgi:beta-lactamase class A
MTILGRRQFILGVGAACLMSRSAWAQDAFAQIERSAQGRLGVCILDSSSGARLSYRGDERFALLSTFKVLAAAAVLARVDRGEEKLERRVSYTKKDIVTYSPETEKHTDEGMTLSAICAAAVALSDNTAGNLMLSAIGGPQGLTSFLRERGDQVTRLDRIETELNEAKPGDPRDTTSPNAMADSLRKLLLGEALKPASRQQLAEWMIASKTGNARIRAGIPADWRSGDKTGTSARNANDVAILWPPARSPLIVASYLAESDAAPAPRDAAHAAIGRIAAAWRG